MNDKTLSEMLAERGIRHEPGKFYARLLYGPSGEYLGAYDAKGAWEELNKPEPFHHELTPAGEQAVIPGCERNFSPKAKQLDLFG